MARLAALAASAAIIAVAKGQSGPSLALNMCGANTAFQVWQLGTGAHPNISLVAQQGGNTMCIDIEDFNTGDNAEVYTWPCGLDGAGTNEQWTINANSIVSNDGGNKCLTAETDMTPAIGSIITTNDCNANDPAQNLHFDSASGHIVHVPSGLCVDARIAATLTFCTRPDHANWTVCDTTAPLDARAADIVSRLSLADKIAALGTSTPALPSVGMAAYNWWSEATHGISHVTFGGETPYSSNTALPITTGCSFNRTLWKATGNQIGREARAFMNVGNAYGTYWTPVLNTVRDPRWGRNIETPGEDPFHVGEYAIAFIKGFEHAPEDPYLLQASACCKHFVGNELDGWNGTDRYHFNAIITDQDLADSYLIPFEACVTQGGVSSMMSSYNAVNGVPSSANDWLLGTVLRESWGFDGYVTSDCDADSDVYNSHHYTATPEEAVAVILKAGTDVDCGSFVPNNANASLNAGTITVDDIDTVLKRLFRVRIRLGTFDPAGPLQTIGPDQVCNAYALELARDGVRQSAVLVKNDNALLPLSSPAAYPNAVVIGPDLDMTDTISYYGSPSPCNGSKWTPLDAIQQWIPSAKGIKGVPDVGSNDVSGVPAAAAAAGAADLVVLTIGSDLMLEREGSDRTSIDFSDGQKALIAAVTANATAPVIALVFSGGAMDISSLLSNPKIAAVFVCGQPSIQVVGVADLIFGKTPDGRLAVPAGRMNQMIYPADIVNQVSLFDFNMRPGPSVWPPGTNPGRTHRFYTGTPVLAYGYGLSYTTFTYTPVDAPSTLDLARTRAILASRDEKFFSHTTFPLLEEAVAYYVNVTNTGSVDADDVVLGFLVPPGAGQNGVPLQELFGFTRVHVPAGQTVTAYIGAQARSFTQVGQDGIRRVHPGDYTIRFGVKETASKGMGFAETRITAA